MSTELTTKESNVLIELDLDDSFQDAITVRSKLITIPQIKLVQKMSAAFDSGLAALGDFACEKKLKNYGNSISIIPISIGESASLLFSKQKIPPIMPSHIDVKDLKESAVLCSSKDMINGTHGTCNKCPFASNFEIWVDNKAPLCRASIDIVCLVRGDEQSGLGNFSFRKSNYKAGTAILQGAIYDELYQKKGILFGASYTLTSKEFPRADAPKQTYHKIIENIQPERLSVDEIKKIIPIAKAYLEAKTQNAINVDSDDDDMPV